MLLYPNAKINLGLNIVARRDDGYHNLETVFYPVKLTDKLEITPNNTADSIRFNTTGGFVLDCADEDNLIVRTCRLLQKEKKAGGVDIRFEKRIPFGAGLGGGSSDAAYTAMALNSIFSLGMSKGELKALVSRLGADCAFFIENSACYAEGIGDILEPISFALRGYTLVLVKPDIAVSTREAYAGITPRRPLHNVKDIVIRPVEQWRGLLVNDFEESVFKAHKELALLKQTLYDMGAAYAAMSGSGATVYGLFRNNPAADTTKQISEWQTQCTAKFGNCFTFVQSLS